MKMKGTGEFAPRQHMGRSAALKRTQRLLLSGALAGFVLVAMAARLAWDSRHALEAASPEGNIARATASLLEHSQFTHHPLDNELASHFLDRYLDTLDGAHMLFLQSDLEEFGPYRQQLAHLTRDVGDTTPAHLIFKRYLKRLDQQVNYFTNQLATAQFDFSGHDIYTPDRVSAPRPSDLGAAKRLWKERLRYDYLQEVLAGEKPAKIVRTLSDRYVRAAARMSRLDDDQVLGLYLDALAHVYDPHSDYFDPEQLEDFSISMNLRLFGVGATLLQRDGFCTIRDLIPGGPAARSGKLNPGDRIVAVSQPGEEPVDIVNMPLGQAVQLIRGPKGTPVELTIIPANASGTAAREVVRLVRDEIHLEEQRAKARLVDLPVRSGETVRLGVIDLPSFYGNTDDGTGGSRASASEDVRALLNKLKSAHVRGVVLDLRHNGGGLLPEAIKLTGLFIPKGPVVQTRDAQGDIDVDKDPDSAEVYDGPLIVLTSRMSASASEILAGALKDYGRALIVGDPSTFGKGTVQSMVPLKPLLRRAGLRPNDEAGALAVTIRKFYRPEGASTQIRGVQSDIVLPSLTDNTNMSEAAQDNPLPWDKVPPQKIQTAGMVDPILSGLREKSAARVASREDLTVLRQAAAEMKSHEHSEPVVLNEAARQAEEAVRKKQEAAWEEALAQVKQPSIRVYDLTVNDSQEAGLPPARQVPLNGQAFATNQTTEQTDDAVEPAARLWQQADRIVLAETERILADYIRALAAPSTPVTALTRPAAQAQAIDPAHASPPPPFERESLWRCPIHA